MTSSLRLLRFCALCLALALAAAPASSQGAPPGEAPPAPPAAEGRATLVPQAGDPDDVDTVTLPARPAAVMSGSSTARDGFDNLKKAFRRIEEELAKAGIAPAGRPLAVFAEAEDDSFRYEAMVPIARIPEGRTTLAPNIFFGSTPSGRALRLVHKGAYEDIDSTYQKVMLYLDAKNIDVRDSDAFIEEYVTDLTSADDEDLEVNIFAMPK